MYLEDRTVSFVFMTNGVESIHCVTEYVLLVFVQIREIDWLIVVIDVRNVRGHSNADF